MSYLPTTSSLPVADIQLILSEGSIFFLYGLLTFGRYLGAWSEYGWAWNRATKKAPSAELVESFVIFFYGATNTWMERFGAEPGSPYTAKQIQHISIAVMYFFGGAIGMALELGINKKQVDGDDVQAYRSSFNPFAALCIGITGVAMAAHHQTYLFQVRSQKQKPCTVYGYTKLLTS